MTNLKVKGHSTHDGPSVLIIDDQHDDPTNSTLYRYDAQLLDTFLADNLPSGTNDHLDAIAGVRMINSFIDSGRIHPDDAGAVLQAFKDWTNERS